METEKPIECPKCGCEVADVEVAASAGGGTVLCKACGALVSLRDQAELAAKGELDSDFDLAICFQSESDPSLPAAAAGGGVSGAVKPGERDRKAGEASVPKGRVEVKRQPEPVAPADWKWSGDSDFDPLRDLPRRDSVEESGIGEAATGDKWTQGPLPEWKSARPASPVAPASAEMPPLVPEREEEPPIHELPPKESSWSAAQLVSPRARATEAGIDLSEDAAGDEGAGLDTGKAAVEKTSGLPSPSEAKVESKKHAQIPLPDAPATPLGAAVAMKRRRRIADTTVSKRAILLIVVASLAVLGGGVFWLAPESSREVGAAKLKGLGSEDVLRGFLVAETAKEREDYIWQTNRLRSEVDAYYGKNGYEKSTIAGMRKMTELPVRDPEEDLVADVYEVQLSDRGATVCYVIRALDRVLGVDWESFEDIASTWFPEFQAGKMPTPTRFRAHAFQDDALWTGEFSDPKRWFCLRLESPKQNWSVFAYAEKNSIIGEQIRQIFKVTDHEIMTVELGYPLGSSSDDQVLLERIVSLDWLTQP